MARVQPHILRVSQAELDEQTGLHEPPPQLRTCVLAPATRRVYDALEKDLIARTDQGVITAANAMVSVTRLAQVTSGYGKDATTGDTIRLAEPPEKLRLLADELDEYDVREPIIVFARFHHDFDEIRALCESRADGTARSQGGAATASTASTWTTASTSSPCSHNPVGPAST